MVWPAIIFANNRTDKLTGLLKYEIISIITIKGKSTIGTPFGKKSSKYLNPCFTKPKIVTPIKTIAASTNVTTIWLVTVNEYGYIPTMLANKTNMNRVNMKGKKDLALDPAVSFIIFAINV